MDASLISTTFYPSADICFLSSCLINKVQGIRSFSLDSVVNQLACRDAAPGVGKAALCTSLCMIVIQHFLLNPFPWGLAWIGVGFLFDPGLLLVECFFFCHNNHASPCICFQYVVVFGYMEAQHTHIPVYLSPRVQASDLSLICFKKIHLTCMSHYRRLVRIKI